MLAIMYKLSSISAAHAAAAGVAASRGSLFGCTCCLVISSCDRRSFQVEQFCSVCARWHGQSRTRQS